MPSIKKCKGTGKSKGFGCNKELPYTENNGIRSYKAKYGLGFECGCYPKWLATSKEGAEILKRAQLSGKRKSEKEKRQKEKAEKEKHINYRKKLQSEVQKIARLIDIGLPCLAKGVHANQLHGGHIYARGGNSSMALNLHNIHRQGAQSNHFQNDDGLLREGLIKEYGQNYYEFVSNLRRTPQLHYNNEEYKNFYRHACKISKKLITSGNRFNLKERIQQRNTINSELGIYSDEFNLYLK